MEALKNILRKYTEIDAGGLLFFTMDQNPFLQDLVAQLNTQGQLSKGLLSDGDELPDYSDVSVEQYGKPAGPIKLFDSGAFWKSWNIELTLDGFIIDADPFKPDGTNLFTKYGEDILGLTDKNLNIFIKELTEQIINEIKNDLQ